MVRILLIGMFHLESQQLLGHCSHFVSTTFGHYGNPLVPLNEMRGY